MPPAIVILFASRTPEPTPTPNATLWAQVAVATAPVSGRPLVVTTIPADPTLTPIASVTPSVQPTDVPPPPTGEPAADAVVDGGAAAIMTSVACGPCHVATNTAVPTDSPSQVSAAAPTSWSSDTPFPTDTLFPTDTPWPTDTPLPTNTAIPSFPSPTPIHTATPTYTVTPLAIPTPTRMATPSAILTAIPTAAPTMVPTATPTPQLAAGSGVYLMALDSAIDPRKGNESLAGAGQLPIRPDADGPACVLLMPDLSALPVGAVIGSARLTVCVVGRSNAAAVHVVAADAACAWDGGTASAGRPDAALGLAGEIATLAQSLPASGQTVAWDVTNIVASWMNGALNHGIVLVAPPELNNANCTIYVAASEWAGGETEPELEISYWAPAH